MDKKMMALVFTANGLVTDEVTEEEIPEMLELLKNTYASRIEIYKPRNKYGVYDLYARYPLRSIGFAI